MISSILFSGTTNDFLFGVEKWLEFFISVYFSVDVLFTVLKKCYILKSRMSKITPKEVREIAKLARLNLSSEEENKYCVEISNILNYMEIIEEIDVRDVCPTAQVTSIKNIVRNDIKKTFVLKREDILNNTPQKERGYIKVRTVLE